MRANQWEAAEATLFPVAEELKTNFLSSRETIAPLEALLAQARLNAVDHNCSHHDAFLKKLQQVLDECRRAQTQNYQTDDVEDRSLRLYENEDEDGSDPGRHSRRHHHLNSVRNTTASESTTIHHRSPFSLDSALGWKDQSVGTMGDSTRGWKNPSRSKQPNRGFNGDATKGGSTKRSSTRTEAGSVLSESIHLNRQLTEILRNLQEIQTAQELIDAKHRSEQLRRFSGQPKLKSYAKVSPVIQERMRSLVASSWTRAFTLVSDALHDSKVRQQVTFTMDFQKRVEGMPILTGLLMHPTHTSTFSLLLGILSTFPGESAAKTASHECIADHYRSKFNHKGGDGERHEDDEETKRVLIASDAQPTQYDPNIPTLTAERRCLLVIKEFRKLLDLQRADRKLIATLKSKGDNRAQKLVELSQTKVENAGSVDAVDNSDGSQIAAIFPSLTQQLFTDPTQLDEIRIAKVVDVAEEHFESNTLEPSMGLVRAIADASKRISSSRIATELLFSQSFQPVVEGGSDPPTLLPGAAIGAIVALTKRRQWEAAVQFVEGVRKNEKCGTPQQQTAATNILTHLNLASHVAACVADGGVYCRRGAALYLFNRGMLAKYPNPHSLQDHPLALNPHPDAACGLDGAQPHDDLTTGSWKGNVIKNMRKDPNALPPDHFKDSSFSHWEYALGVIGRAAEAVSPGLGVVYGLRALRTLSYWEKAVWVLQEYGHHLSGPETLQFRSRGPNPLGNQHMLAASTILLRENSRSWIPPQGIAAVERLLRDPLKK